MCEPKNAYSVSDSTTIRQRDDGGYRVEMDVKNSRYREVSVNGAKGPEIQPVSMTIVRNTQWTNDGWQIRSLVRVK